MSDLTTSADEALAVLHVLDSAGCRAWVGGGWGVDALAGRQTRPHRDLDLAVASHRLDAAITALTSLGYSVETDWLPVRIELHRPGRGRVDLHPLVFADDGSGVQAGPDGTTFAYPADGFTCGTIDGARVRCLARDLQLTFHSGDQFRDVDLHDLAVLTGLSP